MGLRYIAVKINNHKITVLKTDLLKQNCRPVKEQNNIFSVLFYSINVVTSSALLMQIAGAGAHDYCFSNKRNYFLTFLSATHSNSSCSFKFLTKINLFCAC